MWSRRVRVNRARAVPALGPAAVRSRPLVPRRSSQLLTACLVTALASCGGRPPPTPPPTFDDDDEEGAIAIAGIELPRLPLDVEVEDLEEGWPRTEAALTMAIPRPPHGADWEVEAWAEEELGAWMRRRAEAVGVAQRALEPVRAGPPEEAVVASMLLGLAYSRFALDLRGIEVPAAFAEDPVRAAAFRNALETASRPLWERALDAFGSCSATAASAPAHSLAAWRERCDREIRAAAAMIDDGAPED